jgi:hypothetical protein
MAVNAWMDKANQESSVISMDNLNMCHLHKTRFFVPIGYRLFGINPQFYSMLAFDTSTGKAYDIISPRCACWASCFLNA